MKIRYLLSFPFAMGVGGGGQITTDILSNLSKNNECKPLDFEAREIDFDTLFVFGFTFINIHLLKFYKDNGVKVILYPIYDRMKSRLSMKFFNFLIKFPIMNIYSLRNNILNSVDIIMVANESERKDLVEIYRCKSERIFTARYCLSDQVFEKKDTVPDSLFFNKYKIKNFVFCSAVVISKRKNQISLIKALKGTGIKLVLNNTHNIIDGLNEEFRTLTENNNDVICLASLDSDMLFSCYKNAKVNISVSNAETAGLVNLEAGLMGCNLAASALESHLEYIKDHAVFFDQNNISEIRKSVLEALNKPKSIETIKYIEDNYRWENYINQLESIILNFQKTIV